ncbi:xylanase 1 [Cordyceps militaris]|uniref:Xylanase 1 n=1 Tax=Cordyceps militaris TaxID=73501 RepID=A0A2H4SFP3_CORMI|nr:xylanase 1 [Cordyceps militaris]
MMKIGIAALASAQVVDDSQCDCYVTDGPFPTYYLHHGFWDFRSLSRCAGVPAVLPDVAGNLQAKATCSLFDWSDPFTQFWGPQHWSNGNQTFPMVTTYNNLYIEHNPGGESATFLTMRTARLPGFQTAAELQSMSKVDHASIRMRARSHGAPGACTSVFTYLGGARLADVQESDVEMLTREPAAKTIHYTNQPSYREDGSTVAGASYTATLPGGRRWSDWLTHRLDWTPGRTTFGVDGGESHTQTFQAPRDPSLVLLNVWSDGGVWTGKMAAGGEAFQNVQWMEMLYDIVPAGRKCERKCSIDKSPEIGKAVRV